MRHPSKLNRAIASAVLAGCFALAGPGLASAQDGGKAKGKAKAKGIEYTYDPAYMPAEPNKRMLKVVCVSLLRTEIARIYGLQENLPLTDDLRGTKYVGDPADCPAVVEECPDCSPEESFEVFITEE